MEDNEITQILAVADNDDTNISNSTNITGTIKSTDKLKEQKLSLEEVK